MTNLRENNEVKCVVFSFLTEGKKCGKPEFTAVLCVVKNSKTLINEKGQQSEHENINYR